MEIWEGGGVFGLGNLGGRGSHSDPGNPDGRGGGSKNLAICRGVWIFLEYPTNPFVTAKKCSFMPDPPESSRL